LTREGVLVKIPRLSHSQRYNSQSPQGPNFKVMQHSDKHACVPTILKPVAFIKKKMSTYFKKTTCVPFFLAFFFQNRVVLIRFAVKGENGCLSYNVLNSKLHP